MARRKKARKMRSFFARKAKRKGSRSSSSVKLIQIDAMAYGAVREKVSSMVYPIVQPYLGRLGSVADEVAMGGICYLAAKNTSGMIKDIAMKGLVIENARIGEAIAQGSIFNTSTVAPNGNLNTINY